MEKRERICIVGDGGWGTALALLLHKNGHKVTVWSAFPGYATFLQKKRENKKFLPGIKIPKAITITSDIHTAIERNTIIVFAVPTQFIRSVMKKIKDISFDNKICVNVAKGIENSTFLTPDQI
ncbi:NAD(P)-binding domain-containing protein, partial [Candidatus Omnitrophota bacterium]